MRHTYEIATRPDITGVFIGKCSCGKTHYSARKRDVRRLLQKHANRENAAAAGDSSAQIPAAAHLSET